MRTVTTLTLDSIARTVLERIDDPLVVPNLGTNTAAFMRLGPRDADFYLWGGMGLTHSVALGVALAQSSRNVVCVDGDGSLLMGLGGVATIGALHPKNLLHLVVDNSAWGNTGGQPTHTAAGVHLERVADGCGYPVAERVDRIENLMSSLDTFQQDPKLTMIVIAMDFVEDNRAPLTPQPVLIKHRFRSACCVQPANAKKGGASG